MKQKIKKYVLSKFHAIESQRCDVVEAIVEKGVRGFSELNYDDLKSGILDYVSSVRIAPYTYKFAVSCDKPCLYASVYAVMIEGLTGVLAQRSKAELADWANYLNDFQNPDDGIYYDSSLAGPAYEHIGVWNEGWGKHHLMGHIIIALARLGHKPKYQLRYLEKYYDTEYLTAWMNGFDFSDDVWTVSNYFMNLYTVMEYARDYMGEVRASKALETMAKWLLERQNPETGIWHTQDFDTLDHLDKLKVVRAAYHFFPLFVYEKITLPYQAKIVDSILPLQNSWGGWTVEKGNSGACEDIDAVEPLIRFSGARSERNNEISAAILRSLIWQLSCRNTDKGFSFYLRSGHVYGGHPLTSSLRDESSMFATWFRTLCIAYEMQYLGLPNSFEIGVYPGYEMSLHPFISI